ncbi:tRNA (guanine-N(7)-)-methyltransferase non-catalytic subunit wdr4 isoform X1 [Astyanax mexicanus]|uniref:tRNA (guanine-N(7)-)-methyltransferase non-catalytic subunit wdr4 isoform X1 n=1 Tax=Astyanax mexicanus TaxID=7994 RepID=UPI0020CAA161|nr:tRNA (guanine-N(7)-)-methyltransferase non-catalytic subunit wdr4 isoform X1 [Astyanax mexicanus]
MAAVCCAGDWLLTCSSQYLVAVNIRQSREPFVFDCSKAEQKPTETEAENKSDGGGSEEKGSDRILACTISTSGNYAALTDDNKRLILFRTQPSWQCISTRWVVRRCTSLMFSQAEDELFVADKSGDVYSFSVLEPQKQGELKLGHLSMLLAITLSPDDKYIITADRDEKIRVSLRQSPYNIQAFCLGHTEFVSTLFVPTGHPEWLLSGSGDGTLKLWHYETGRRLQSINMKQLGFSQSSETDAEKPQRFAVSRIISSPNGRHVAVQCERFPSIQLFEVKDGSEELLIPTEKLTLPHAPWDMAFDSEGRLWVLLQNKDVTVLLYTYSQDCWKQIDSESADLQRVEEALSTQWDFFKDSVGVESRFQHLYKVNFDNMASYLQKKQERLQQQDQKEGKKRTGGNGSQSNGAAKKSKNERKREAVPSNCS